ncbi:MAG: PD-(D/E)XK nuclease family protein [Armatimonadota bacterium]
MWNLFRNCRKACEYRYVRGLVPICRDPHLTFGAAMHQALGVWHGGGGLLAALEKLDGPLARAMMEGYAARYPDEDFEVVALERTFEGPIVNPATGAPSRSFVLAGRVDGIVRRGDRYYILEHKTASSLDNYLERLPSDFQALLYALYAERVMGLSISGVIYNVLVKARLQQGRGESEREFTARRAELLAKSKTGKTSAVRRLPETEEEFAARLRERYSDPAMFHREEVPVTPGDYAGLSAELWELTQAFLDARRRGVWYRNTSYCFLYNRPCAYFPLCRSGESALVRESLYQRSVASGQPSGKPVPQDRRVDASRRSRRNPPHSPNPDAKSRGLRRREPCRKR